MITRRLARPLGAIPSGNWVCPSCSRASFNQSRFQTIQSRKLHKVPLLANYDQVFRNEGVPGLYSPDGFKVAWSEYQGIVVKKLNELTAGEPYEHIKPKDLVIQFARDPSNASLFNHASMAFNNHFYFESLSTSPVRLDRVPDLPDSLEATFGSIDTLRTTMLDSADAMFGPGFVWLVWVHNINESSVNRGAWRILTTYLGGTPFPEAGFRHQGLDMNVNNPQSYQDYYAREPVNNVGAFGPSSRNGKENASIPPGGKALVPVLCVNTWQHAWMLDYRIGGKRNFLANWWDVVDWGVVLQRTPEGVFNSFKR